MVYIVWNTEPAHAHATSRNIVVINRSTMMSFLYAFGLFKMASCLTFRK